MHTRPVFFAALALSLGASPSVRAAWTFDSFANTLSDGTFVLRNVTVSGSTLTIGDNRSNAGIAGDVDLSSGIVGGYVVKLGGSCFQNNSSLTGFKSGAELIATGNSAFQSCSALTNADLSASTGLTALSQSLFNGCKKLRRVAIPSTIATIGSSAFQNCSELEMDVNDLLPPGLSGPLYRAFYNSPKLYGDVVLPAGVTAISGDFAKSAITSFRTAEESALATIGHSAGYAEDATFSGCAALTNVVFQDTIATFYGQNNHFQNCSALVNVTLPGITAPSSHVVSGGGGAKGWSSTFRDCLVLTNAFTIPDDVRRLTQTFDGSKCIRGVALGKSVRQIGNFSNSESAFTDNRALEFVDMSATTNLTDIGQLNFSSCLALRELTIPDTVTNIGRQAFANCTSLTNLVLPAGLQKIGSQAFKNVAKNTGLLCDIWWSGTPDAPPAGIGTSDSVMGYDEGASHRITHHFWIGDEDYWAAWASDNAEYVELPPTEKRKVKGTWKDHNGRTQYILWWYPKDFTLLFVR